MTDEQKILAIRQATSLELAKNDGKIWKESAGELHLHYHEMPNWILLFDRADLDAAHEAFSGIVGPYMAELEPVQMTVSYMVLTRQEEVLLDFLETNAEIRAGRTMFGELGGSPETKPRRGQSVFRSEDSSRS